MPVASAARELTPLPDDAGLRTVLRNVPLLPAPANVDDLVARLDAEEVPVSSGPLAELISDARYIEAASNATQSDEANDRFFAPVARAANTNRRPPLAPRLLSGLFNAALLAGALLILWNALLAPDGAPPPVTPMKTAESATASDLTKAPALTVAADEPTPETRTDNAMSPETPASPVKPLEPYRPLASMDAVALPEPELEPVPTTPDPVVEAEAHQARGMLLAVDPAQSEPAPVAPVPAPDVDLAQPHGTIVSPEPISETVASTQCDIHVAGTSRAHARSAGAGQRGGTKPAERGGLIRTGGRASRAADARADPCGGSANRSSDRAAAIRSICPSPRLFPPRRWQDRFRKPSRQSGRNRRNPGAPVRKRLLPSQLRQSGREPVSGCRSQAFGQPVRRPAPPPCRRRGTSSPASVRGAAGRATPPAGSRRSGARETPGTSMPPARTGKQVGGRMCGCR